MLNRGKKSGYDKEAEPGKIPEEKSFAPTLNPVTKDEKTVIGEHISIEGSIRGEEHLAIEGSMQGNIEMRNHNFVVGSKGRFEGDIRARNVTISGQVTGTINVQGKVKITQEADFSGDIKAKGISVEDGAYFKGSIELDREPTRKAAITGKAPDKPFSPLEKASDHLPDKAAKVG